MPNFLEFVKDAARKGEILNTLFEERVFELVGALDRVVKPLEQAGISYELVGGMAVFVHVRKVDQAAARNTKDLDLLIHRSDLERIVEVAGKYDFVFRHAAGVDMLLFKGAKANPVHFVFAGEKVRPDQPYANPPVQPVREQLHGSEFWVIPVADLVAMKLSSNRLRDQLQILDMNGVGLITPKIKEGLPIDLQARLDAIRLLE